MITCIVVDDEQHALDVLVDYVNDTPFMELVLATTDAIEASVRVQQEEVDLVFLDIHMPKMHGLRFMKLVGDKTKIVLTTAYSEYAIQGYEFGVIDYLVKPISYDRFLKAVQKMPFSKQLVDDYRTTQIKEEDDDESGFIFVKTEAKGKYQRVNFKDILYIEGLKNYVSIYTAEDRIVCNLSVTDLENKLPADRFLRVHKSYIISVHKITAIEGNEIILKKMLRVPIGATYRDRFFEAIKDSIFAKNYPAE